MSKTIVELVKKLRTETGATITECKKALESVSTSVDKWDFDKARDILLKIKSCDKKTGGIFSYIHHNRQMGAMVELSCESDLTSKKEEFVNLGNNIAAHIAANNSMHVEQLLKQNYIKEPTITVGDLIDLTSFKLNDKVKVNRFTVFSV